MIPRNRRDPNKLRHRPLCLLALFSTAAGLTSCTPTLSSNVVSGQLQTALQEQGITVEAVNCPQNVLIPPYLQADAGIGDGEAMADPGAMMETDGGGADVSGADVTGGDVTGGDVTGGDVTGGDVTGDVSGADVTGGDVTGGDVTGTDVAGGDVSGADVSGTDVSGADVSGADVTGGDVTGTDVAGGDVTGAEMGGADMGTGTGDPAMGTESMPADPAAAGTTPGDQPSDVPPPMLTLVESLHRPFACTGTLEPEGSFPILVSRRTEQGQVQWAVPNSRSMLSMQELSSEIGAAIAQTTGSPPTLDCGTGFRVNRPGSSFECNASGTAPIEENGNQYTLVSVRVNTDPEGNISWQQVRQQGAAAPLPSDPTMTDGTLPPLDGTGTDPAFNSDPFTSSPSITDDPGAAISP